MGWTGHYTYVDRSTREDVLGVLDSVLAGKIIAHSFSREKDADNSHVVYLAVKLDSGDIRAVVALYQLERGEVLEKTIPETYHPYYYKCPKRILDLLTPTTNEDALKWRAQCRQRRS